MPGLLSGQCRAPCGLRITPVDRLQHAGHLRGGDGNHTIHGRRPDVLPALETLGIKRHADTIMPDDLAEVAAASPENVEAARVGITSETLLHLQGQSSANKKRCRPATETAMPLSASAKRSSSRVMSLRSSQMARMSAARSSIRRERISPPRGFGAMSPASRCCTRQRTAVDGATPNRSAAARQLDCLSTAAKSRARRSIERTIHVGLLHQQGF